MKKKFIAPYDSKVKQQKKKTMNSLGEWPESVNCKSRSENVSLMNDNQSINKQPQKKNKNNKQYVEFFKSSKKEKWLKMMNYNKKTKKFVTTFKIIK